MPGYRRAFTSELRSVTRATQLPDIAADVVTVQADPANTVNVMLAVGNGSPRTLGHALEAGKSATIEAANANMVWIDSADGTAVRVTFTVLEGCG